MSGRRRPGHCHCESAYGGQSQKPVPAKIHLKAVLKTAFFGRPYCHIHFSKSSAVNPSSRCAAGYGLKKITSARLSSDERNDNAIEFSSRLCIISRNSKFGDVVTFNLTNDL